MFKIVIVALMAGLVFAATMVLAQEGRAPVEHRSARVEVVPPGLTAKFVVPILSSLDLGATMQFTAMCGLSDGSVVDCSDQVTWESFSPAVLIIDPDTGIATGMKFGIADVGAHLRDDAVVVAPTPNP